jgi:hypothetical protein
MRDDLFLSGPKMLEAERLAQYLAGRGHDPLPEGG